MATAGNKTKDHGETGAAGDAAFDDTVDCDREVLMKTLRVRGSLRTLSATQTFTYTSCFPKLVAFPGQVYSCQRACISAASSRLSGNRVGRNSNRAPVSRVSAAIRRI